jgi:UDP-glucuronate 4-epimerase
MSKVLVTGAAGFIGSHLTDRLLQLGHEVFGVDGFTEYYSPALKSRNLSDARSHKAFDLIEGDLLDLDLSGVLREVDSIVHLAAEPGVRASWDNFPTYLKRNVEATHRLLEAALGHELERFVFASSSSIYGSAEHGPAAEDARRRPASPYGLSKLAAEELVALYSREKGVPATSLRYFTVYGPRQRPEMAISKFISAIVRGEPVTVFGDGEQVREMTYVSDVVNATVSALEAPAGGVYNVGGGDRTTVNELLRVVGEALQTEVRIEYAPRIAGEARVTWADLSRSSRELGFQPRVSLEEGVAAQVEWTLEEGLAEG